MRIGWYRILALAAIVTGCGPGEHDRADILPKPSVHRGLAVFGHEVRSFAPCGAEEKLWAIDSSGALWDLHAEMTAHDPPYQSVFAMVEGRLGSAPRDGFGSDYAGTLVVDDVLYVAREGFGCDFTWEAFRYRALGNEPFWSADMTTTNILLRQLGEDERTWTLTQEHVTGQVISFAGDAEGNDPIVVEIERKACRDTMSGAFYGYAVTIRVGESILMGCALKGHEAIQTE